VWEFNSLTGIFPICLSEHISKIKVQEDLLLTLKYSVYTASAWHQVHSVVLACFQKPWTASSCVHTPITDTQHWRKAMFIFSDFSFHTHDPSSFSCTCSCCRVYLSSPLASCTHQLGYPLVCRKHWGTENQANDRVCMWITKALDARPCSKHHRE